MLDTSVGGQVCWLLPEELSRDWRGPRWKPLGPHGQGARLQERPKDILGQVLKACSSAPVTVTSDGSGSTAHCTCWFFRGNLKGQVLRPCSEHHEGGLSTLFPSPCPVVVPEKGAQGCVQVCPTSHVAGGWWVSGGEPGPQGLDLQSVVWRRTKLDGEKCVLLPSWQEIHADGSCQQQGGKKEGGGLRPEQSSFWQPQEPVGHSPVPADCSRMREKPFSLEYEVIL